MVEQIFCFVPVFFVNVHFHTTSGMHDDREAKQSPCLKALSGSFFRDANLLKNPRSWRHRHCGELGATIRALHQPTSTGPAPRRQQSRGAATVAPALPCTEQGTHTHGQSREEVSRAGGATARGHYCAAGSALKPSSRWACSWCAACGRPACARAWGSCAPQRHPWRHRRPSP